MKETKTYFRPVMIKATERKSTGYICCGLGSKSTCSINRSRIS